MTLAARPVRAVDLWAQYRANRRSRRHIDGLGIYVTCFTIILLVAMGGSAIASVGLPLASCTGRCAVFLTWSPGLSALATGMLAMLFSALLGPISASPALCFWMLSGPTPRDGLLRPLAARVALISAALGVISAVVTLVVVGGSLWWLATFSALTTAITLGFMSVQADDRADHTLGMIVVGSLVGTVGILAAVGLAFGGVAAPRFSAEVLALLAVACAFFAWIRAIRRSSDIPVRLLSARSALNRSLLGATSGGDPWLVFDILTEKLLPADQPSARLRSSMRATSAIAVLEAQRVLFRSPKVLLGLPLPLAVLGLATGLHMASIGQVAASLALMVSLCPVLTTLRVLHRSPGLARCFPHHPTRLRLAASTGAVLVCIIWMLAAALLNWAVIGTSPLTALATAACITAAGLSGAVRWTGGSAPDFSTGYIITDAGPVPISALAGLSRGPDLALLAILPLSLGSPIPIALAAALGTTYYAMRRG